ncbi:hypothetical protein ABEB36_012182 [Hypothenemus hampei]|uniref:Uncharacterized protein n=1 Tax=Hypothenemus hampei TaxID=57062 RepID=A0ABD1EAJ2_HYPHA
MILILKCLNFLLMQPQIFAFILTDTLGGYNDEQIDRHYRAFIISFSPLRTIVIVYEVAYIRAV